MSLLIEEAYKAGYTIHEKCEAIVITPLWFRNSDIPISELNPRDGIREEWSACIDQTGEPSYILVKNNETILNGVGFEAVKEYLIENLEKEEVK